MIKKINLTVLFLLLFSLLFGQKKMPLSIEDMGKWPQTISTVLSDDGVFFATSGQEDKKKIDIRLKSIDGKVSKIFYAKNRLFNFSIDSRYFVFINAGDSLVLFDLKRNLSKYYRDITGFTFHDEHLLCTGMDKSSLLLDFSKMKMIVLGEAAKVQFSADRKLLAILKNMDGKFKLEIRQGDMTRGQEIFSADKITDLVTVPLGGGFVVNATNDGATRLWHFKPGMSDVEVLLKLTENGLDINVQFDFSPNGRLLYVRTKKLPGIIEQNGLNVDVWSYLDPKIMSQQLKTKAVDEVTRVIDLNQNREVFRFAVGEDILSYLKSNSYLMVRKTPNMGSRESHWNRLDTSVFFLVDTKKWERLALPNAFDNSGFFSPKEDFLICYDWKAKDFFSYEIATGILRNITKGIKATWTNPKFDYGGPNRGYNWDAVRWSEDGRYVYLHDYYDYWKIDITGVEPTQNVTLGYGKSNDLAIYPLNMSTSIWTLKSSNVFTVFSYRNKKNGFATLENGKFELLSFKDELIYAPTNHDVNIGIGPRKSKNAGVYLVHRSSATEYPNYFITRDFKDFKQITFEQPQKQFNWLTTELLSLKTKSGRAFQGILYKPEDFDPGKRYPVIISYYERASDNLNSFWSLFPQLSKGRINIPYYVSNGYLVVTPDMNFKVGEPGNTASETVDAVADYLSGLSYVDSTKMGIQGHSFGGYQTNQIVANSNRFAAACSAAGFSNLIWGYNSLTANGDTKQGSFYELGQTRMGRTLWEDKHGYIDQSPILKADRITTPLLIMHNNNDDSVPFSNGTELFTALRRLGKKVWLLQYDGQGHALQSPKAQRDFTIRMKQFFDHYLMGAAAPKWMLDGIPARLKGIEDGLELDTTGRTPGPGLLRKN